MATFTLDDIRQAAEAKYGDMTITLDDGFEARLLNPLRLSKEAREELTRVQDQANEEGDDATDQEESLKETVRIVCEKKVQADRLLEQMGGDLTLLASLLDKYGEVAQVGEA